METTKEIRWWEVEEPPETPALIRKVESRKRADVIELLASNGIQSRSRSFRDYEKAKKLCFMGLLINSRIYDKQIKWICDYLNI